ncbi:beclin 1-associated autophagy-related key regulator [Cimex lectularius]|uniref:Beclin 1-associated autophagy-related key regulator n=1 Tax=Cimex lectularius TaxID=79782 RepID=A0A8I6S2K2_CIMLE|nr:beclin 1-associated autophagy-related key regulator [Cimex lectularius]
MTSSSGDSAAPLDFHISSSCEDNGKLVLATEDCPLCCKAKRIFYCKYCIKNGNFLHSSSRCSESFIDKKLKLLTYKQEKAKAQQSIEKKLTPHLKIARMKSDIKTHNERILFLKRLIQDKKETIAEKKEKVKILTETNNEKKIRLPRYEDRVGQLKGYVKKRSNDLKEQEENLKNIRDKLMRLRKVNIKQLVQYIFPITVVKPSVSHEEDSDTVSALEDACRTAYVQGKWVFTNISSELQHCIVAPTLPSSGDYTAYSDWVAANKDGVPTSTNTIDFNPAYNISAALTYTTQLVNMLAYYLDIRLPSKLCYSEFCTSELSKEKFTKRVARLNWNVIHLCLSQNVNPSLLKAESTLGNILQLLEAAELGRTGACEIDPEATKTLEEMLRPGLEICSDSEDSEDDSEHLSYEWESVANVGLPEVEAGPAQNLASQQLSSSSVAGGLLTSTAASIVSLWRGWATNR